MRLLIANPNMTIDMTDRLAKVSKHAAASDTEILPATATHGFPYISSRAEAQIAGANALEMIAEHIGEIDAAVIAAFGDPGLKAARELFDIPVVGMAEAAIVTAAMLGERFSIVTFAPTMSNWFTEQATAGGFATRFAGVRTPERPPADITTAGDTMKDVLADLVRHAQEEDGADVVILGGAPLAGLSFELQDRVSAVLVDPISAAVKQAEALAVVAPQGASGGCYTRPGPKASTGLNPALAAWIARKDAGS